LKRFHPRLEGRLFWWSGGVFVEGKNA
jgi:hypothetical protein